MKILYACKQIGLVACVLVMTACGNKLTAENLVAVKPGMSPEEVRKILGKPHQVETGEMIGLSNTTFTYKKGDVQVVVGFINDKVTYKKGSFD